MGWRDLFFFSPFPVCDIIRVALVCVAESFHESPGKRTRASYMMIIFSAFVQIFVLALDHLSLSWPGTLCAQSVSIPPFSILEAGSGSPSYV